MSDRPTDPARRPLVLGVEWDVPGGLNRDLRDLVTAYRETGRPSRVLVLAEGGVAPADADQVASVGAPSLGLPARVVGFARAARRERATTSVVDAHFALFAWWPVRWGSLRTLPLVVHFHGPWAQESASQGSSGGAAVTVKKWLERSLYTRADALVVLSDAFRRLLVEQYDVAPGRVHVVRPGVDLVRFTPDRAGARRRLGIDDGRPLVFTARRLVPRMGLSVLLEAWRDVVARSPHEQAPLLLVAGDGPERTRLEQQVVDLGLGDSVRLLGRVPEEALPDHYRAADAVVLPSLSLEGFGLAAVEALACGTPVVVTDVGGLPEVVDGLDDTLVVPAGDARALADRLDLALQGKVPDAARCRAHAERFTWAAAAETHAQLYGQVTGDRAGPLQVVYLDHCALLSGAEIALARLLPALTPVAAHVVLAEDGALTQVLRDGGVDVTVRPLAGAARSLGRGAVRPGGLPLRSLLATVSYTAGLAVHLRRLRPDLVHTNSLKAALYGSVAGRLAGVPVVWHARDGIETPYLPAPAARLVRAVAARLPTLVIANSHSTLATLRLPATRAAVVVGDPYAPRRPLRDARPAGPLVVGMVGRLAAWKGQDVFLRAMAQARLGDGARAVVVGAAMFGEQDYEQQLRRLVVDLGLSDRVELRGFRDDVEAELEGFDVLVHASVTPEPFGQVVVEGMAAGVPVVACAAGGPSEIVEDGVTGLLYPPGDAAALARALERLADDPDLAARIGEAGRAASVRYAPAAIAEQVLTAYRSVLP